MEATTRIGNFVLFERLARTAFGDSYRAGRILGNVVERHVMLQLFNGPALDVRLFWQLVSDRRQLRESLSDPHLAECLAFDNAEQVPYAAYSLPPSRSLRRFFAAVGERKLPVPLDQALFIIERVALGLTAAHGTRHRGRPVLHGFLVPELIQLTGDGEIQVAGIEAAPGLRNQLSRHAAFAPFLAPEVHSAEPPAETDDVYSLGALLFQLLCGNAPPAASEEVIAEALIDARLAAGGERLPPVISNLLANSLAPRARRIPNSVAWQQVLGRIILDGEHNPTTFNLSFLMHTVFRKELDEEHEAISREQGLRISKLRAGSAEKEELDQPATNDEAPSGVVPAELLASGSDDRTPSSFFTGFAVSFVSATLLLAVYFLILKSPSASALEDPAPSARTILLSERPVTDPVAPPPEYAEILDRVSLPPDSLDSDTASETSSSRQAEEASDEPPPLRSDGLESDLRAEYEDKLRELEDQLANARRSDSGVPTSGPDTDPNQTQAAEVPPQPTATRVQPAVEGVIPPTADDSRTAERLSQLSTPGVAATAVEDSVPTPSAQEDATEARPSDSDTESTANPPPATVDTGTPEVPPSFVPPSLESPPRPVYPSTARRLRKAATVSVRVLVDAEGRVSQAELAGDRVGFGFDAAALSAAKRSKWNPATRNGGAVEAWATLKIEFQP